MSALQWLGAIGGVLALISQAVGFTWYLSKLVGHMSSIENEMRLQFTRIDTAMGRRDRTIGDVVKELIEVKMAVGRIDERVVSLENIRQVG